MTANMGGKTRIDIGGTLENSTYESVGFIPRKNCLACGKPRHKPSDKCSKKLQQMKRDGEI